MNLSFVVVVDFTDWYFEDIRLKILIGSQLGPYTFPFKMAAFEVQKQNGNTSQRLYQTQIIKQATFWLHHVLTAQRDTCNGDEWRWSPQTPGD